MTFRVEEYSNAQRSVTISVDWDTPAQAKASFVEMLLSHGMSASDCGNAVLKLNEDFRAGANIIEVATEDGFTISYNELSKLGHST